MALKSLTKEKPEIWLSKLLNPLYVYQKLDYVRVLLAMKSKQCNLLLFFKNSCVYISIQEQLSTLKMPV